MRKLLSLLKRQPRSSFSICGRSGYTSCPAVATLHSIVNVEHGTHLTSQSASYTHVCELPIRYDSNFGCPGPLRVFCYSPDTLRSRPRIDHRILVSLSYKSISCRHSQWPRLHSIASQDTTRSLNHLPQAHLDPNDTSIPYSLCKHVRCRLPRNHQTLLPRITLFRSKKENENGINRH